MVLMVEDDGAGITEDSVLNGQSLGLLGMCERARALGGQVEVGEAPRGGTLVVLRLPYGETA
jgi:two-component system, NarL family, sensor histidine kinase UhpB